MSDKIVEQDAITLRTYAKAWKFDTVIYSVGDVTLPFAVNITQAGFFAASLLITMIICAVIPPLGKLPFMIKFVIIPFAGMKAATSLKLEGKQPHKWIFGFFKYLVIQPKLLSRFKKYTSPKPFTFEGTQIYGKIKGEKKA